MNTIPDRKVSGARVRGAIQKGETGDKVPGFDPAAAPLETDAEAGGESVAMEPQARREAGDSNASSHASGLRPFETLEKLPEETSDMREGHAYLIGWLIILSLVAAGYFITLWVWR